MKDIIITLIFGAVIGALWQINIAIDSLENNWDYALPFKLRIYEGLQIYDALDIWYFVIIVSIVSIILMNKIWRDER